MTPAVRWLGPLFDWSSHAEVARGLVRGLHAAGVACAVTAPQAMDGPTLADVCDGRGDLVEWLQRFADQRALPMVLAGLPVTADGFDLAGFVADRHPGLPHAVFAMCETDRVALSWVETLNRMERVWVPTRFCAAAFTEGGVDPAVLRVLEPGVAAPARSPRRVVRSRSDDFTFLSIQARDPRKNLIGLVDAFADVFDGDAATRLLVKTTPPLGGQVSTAEVVSRRLDELGATSTWVEVQEELLERRELDHLLERADAFVLASHGEGIGLPYLDALMRGVPVVAAAWGGHTDFLDGDVAEMVSIDRLVTVPGDAAARAPHLAGLRWALPSRQHLVETLRRVREDHCAALERAERGRMRIAAGWTHAVAGVRARALVVDLADAALRPRTPPPPASAELIWTGLFYGANSFAVEARDYVLALDDAGARVGLEPVPGPGPPIELDPAIRRRLDRLRLRRPGERWVDVQHCEPAALAPRQGAAASVGRTMFETEGLPPGWMEKCRAMTEVWLPSDPVAEMFVRHGLADHQAVVIPEAVSDPYFDPPTPVRRPVAASKMLLSVFDWQYRKGWDVLLRAYARAFSADDDIVLAILTHSMLRYSRADIERAARAAMDAVRADRRPRVEFVPSPVPEAQMPSLFAAADAYVLPTRGEGWGRPFAAAMAANTLVVATDAGGHRHFLDDGNALLVPSRLVEVPPEAARERPVYAGLRWNEPDEDALVEMLRLAVTEDHAERIAMARARVESFRRPAIAQRMLERVGHLLA